ncbi:MAG: segregation/condensation protein A [Phycisphaerales bacterium]|nr:segregation/condensation protein A [Phycisphaerales bacterium]
MSFSQEQFRITIDAFDGPLDLLLYLVKRAEVDIYEIPIAQIADDYLEVLRTSAAIDVEMAGEFLVMAATLIELKSRSLVPVEKLSDINENDKIDADPTDPKDDLIRQLLAYQRFRTAAEKLDEQKNAHALKYNVKIKTAIIEEPSNEHALELDDVHIIDLADAYEHIASAIDFDRIGEHHVAFDDVPIELCQEDILDRLQRSQSRKLTLQETFRGMQLQERIGMFLATLELVRLRQITIIQDEHFDSIIIKPIEETTEAQSPS